VSGPTNYSFIDQHVAGSAQPYDIEDIEQYYTDGIRHIISLTPNKPLVTKYMDDRINVHHLPVYGVPDDVQINNFLQIVDIAKEKDEKVVIHCQFGQERTGMFLAVYLIEKKNLTPKQAIAQIRELRPSSLRSTASLNFIMTKYSG
jgi:protein-tyrosine phosphatase